MSRKPASRRARATPHQTLDRHARVQLEAYLIAERRGFAPGNEIDDWLEAERRVDTAVVSTDRP